MDKTQLIIGIDLGIVHNQISYYEQGKQEAVSVSRNEKEDTYLIPNNLFFQYEDGKWYFGEQAKTLSKTHNGESYHHILSHLGDMKTIVLEGKEYGYQDLFCVLIEQQLKHCFGSISMDKIKGIVFTTQNPCLQLVKTVAYFANTYQIDPLKVQLSSYRNSNIQYIFSQDRGVWMNGVGVFNYTVTGLEYYMIRYNRSRRPAQIEVTEVELPAEFPYMNEIDLMEEADERLLEIAKQVTKGQMLSAIYMTGEGFTNAWCEKTLAYLCMGKRIFMGQNLYVKGACLLALGLTQTQKDTTKTIVIAKDTVHYDIGVTGYYKGREVLVALASGGEEWFNVKGEVDVFLDDSNRVEIQFINQSTKEITKEIIEIKGLPVRPAKTTKLAITAEYKSGTKGIITIRDKGFGTLYPTTGRVYKKEFSLQ